MLVPRGAKQCGQSGSSPGCNEGVGRTFLLAHLKEVDFQEADWPFSPEEWAEGYVTTGAPAWPNAFAL